MIKSRKKELLKEIIDLRLQKNRRECFIKLNIKTEHFPLSGCKVLVADEYVSRHYIALMISELQHG